MERHLHEPTRAAGFLELPRARVRYLLSIDPADLPPGIRARRLVSIDGEAVAFDEGFTDLHTRSYQAILAGEGFGIAAARPTIALLEELRARRVTPASLERAHPLLRVERG